MINEEHFVHPWAEPTLQTAVGTECWGNMTTQFGSAAN